MSAVSPTQHLPKPSLVAFTRLVFSSLKSSRLLAVDLGPALRFWEAAMSDDAQALNVALSSASTWSSVASSGQHSALAALAARAQDFELSNAPAARKTVLNTLLHSADLNAPLTDAHLLSAPAIPRARHLDAGQLAKAQTLPSPEQRLGRDARLLHWAAASGRLGLVNALLGAGANPDGASGSSDVKKYRSPTTSPLCLAIENGHLDVASALLAANARLRTEVDASDERRFLNAVEAIDARVHRGLNSALGSPARTHAAQWATWALEHDVPVLARPLTIEEPQDVLDCLCAALERKALWRAALVWTALTSPQNWMEKTRHFFAPQNTPRVTDSFSVFFSALQSLDTKAIRDLVSRPALSGLQHRFADGGAHTPTGFSGVEWVALAAAHRAAQGTGDAEKERLALEVLDAFMPLNALHPAPSHTTEQARLIDCLNTGGIGYCEPAVAALLPPIAFAQWSKVANAFNADGPQDTDPLTLPVQAHQERQALAVELAPGPTATPTHLEPVARKAKRL